MNLKLRVIAAASLLSLVSVDARAQIMGNAPVASNAYITSGGFDWAWAYPLPAGSGLVINPFQMSQGWRIPTMLELVNAPLAVDFMFRGANVTFGGSDPLSGAHFQAQNANLVSDAACATPWFSDDYTHCDWFNGRGQTPGEDWAGTPNSVSYAEQLVIRQSNVAVVPEPSSVALMAAGLAGLAFAARRRRKA